ncbi:DNA polymerase IV [hydrothermal vent metagenome]|uniref:DNA-directed DNA polymerase n=1 Tax=hydrothermal vent metagenome TaxID=652676 RepID=A0A3B0Z3V9_9ZZZZ
MILHIDMDAFFASVETRDNPLLKGKPVAVGGRSTTRGVIAAASYEARKFGVRSAMPTITAFKLCPSLVLVPVNMASYVQVSRSIHEIFNRYTPEIEPLSLDEAFLDVTASETLLGAAAVIGQKIKSTIASELNLVASVGVATNKFIAKIASDILKPDGFCEVKKGQEQSFLDPLPIERLWGVGKKTAQRFKHFGLKTIRDVRTAGMRFMQSEFGHAGSQIYLLSNGQDKRPVDSRRSSKSVSNETTFSNDISDTSELRACLMSLVEQVSYRLREANIKGRTVSVKLRDPDFNTITRSKTCSKNIDSTDMIWNIALTLLLKEVPKKFKSLRLIGVGVSNFNQIPQSPQQALFNTETPEETNSNRKMPILDKVSDDIRSRFGRKSIHRGRSTKND